MGANITIRYPFHPLYGQTLAVASKARRADGAETVVAPDGSRLKIPAWMTTPEAEGHAVSDEIAIGSRALLRLVEVIRAAAGEDLVPLPSSSTPGAAMLEDAKRRTRKADRAPTRRAGHTDTVRKDETTEPGIGDGTGDCLARGEERSPPNLRILSPPF